MKRFQFRLETLLKFRGMQKDNAQQQLAQATQNLQRAQTVLQQLYEQLATEQAEFQRQQLTERVTVDWLMMFTYYFEKMDIDIANQQEQVRMAEAAYKESLKQLEEAVKKYKAVKNLREKRLQQYNIEVLAEEQKQLDEMGAQIFLRVK